MTTQSMTGMVKETNGELNRTNKVSSSGKEVATIVLSNKYGELDTGTSLDGVREEGSSGEENKENLNMNV